MLALPVYLRGGTYYLHTRIGGQQFKRSLRTASREMAIIRATKLLEAVMIRKFEIDIGRGIFKADDEDDFQRMLKTLEMVERLGVRKLTSSEEAPLKGVGSESTGLQLGDVLDKLFLLKKNLSTATVHSYKSTISDFSKYLKNPVITDVGKGDVSLYQEKLAKEGNSVRTIDNKIATIRTLFYFAIKQGYYFKENPAQNRTLQSKRDKIKNGYSIFTEEEIKGFFGSERFRAEKETDPDYYWAVLIALLTGCRISEVTSIQAKEVQKKEGFWVIKVVQSKTLAGIREVPISTTILDGLGFDAFLKDKVSVFKYKQRDGKGSGNAVGKKFSRHLEELKLSREKLVFHSLRKFTNDFFMRNGVSLEARSQYFGHEVDNVNINFYTGKQRIEELFKQVERQQIKLSKLVGFI